MKAVENNTPRHTKSIAAYNMIPNLLWTALFVLPVFVYCYRFMALNRLFILLGAAVVPLFFPNSFFDKIQLSKRPEFYTRIGIRYVNALAQNGSILLKLLRKKYPGIKVLRRNRNAIRKQYYQTYFFEKFHFALFVFFVCVAVHAFMAHRYDWLLVLMVCNLFYNVYPNLLQQYVRVKLRPAVDKQ